MTDFRKVVVESSDINNIYNDFDNFIDDISKIRFDSFISKKKFDFGNEKQFELALISSKSLQTKEILKINFWLELEDDKVAIYWQSNSKDLSSWLGETVVSLSIKLLQNQTNLKINTECSEQDSSNYFELGFDDRFPKYTDWMLSLPKHCMKFNPTFLNKANFLIQKKFYEIEIKNLGKLGEVLENLDLHTNFNQFVESIHYDQKTNSLSL